MLLVVFGNTAIVQKLELPSIPCVPIGQPEGYYDVPDSNPLPLHEGHGRLQRFGWLGRRAKGLSVAECQDSGIVH